MHVTSVIKPSQHTTQQHSLVPGTGVVYPHGGCQSFSGPLRSALGTALSCIPSSP
uniref:Uncharacterized protein n=1 Tax=Anguilla anguilla TaxID=7936 RepID=A0A0E9XJZ0_ANGAN